MRYLAPLLTPMLFLLSCSRPPPTSVTWDFTHDFDMSRVGWPASNTTEHFIQAGRFDFSLVMPYHRLSHETAFYLSASRRGNRRYLEWFIVHFAARSTLDEAYEHAKRILTDWHRAKALTLLDEWYAEMKSGKSRPRSFDYNAYVSLRIHYQDSGISRPCSISIDCCPDPPGTLIPPTHPAGIPGTAPASQRIP